MPRTGQEKSQAIPRTREQGVIKWFNPIKGFGFISRGGINPDIFFHISEMPDQLKKEGVIVEGISVLYEIGHNRKGFVALNIEILVDKT